MTDNLRFLRTDEAYRLIEGNATRGFYHIYTYYLDKEENEADWVYSLDVSERLALLIIDISGARDRELNELELKKLERIFLFFEENGYRMIVRAVYDRVGNGLAAEPDSIITVMRHLDQLGEVCYRHSDGILTWQGLLVGSWGEMHSSRFMSDENLLLFYERFRTACKASVILSVRKIDMIDTIKSQYPDDRIGLFDDGIMGDDTDFGTYDKGQREAFLERVAQVANEAPIGGEISGLFDTEEEIVEYLKALKLTYVNSVYDSKYLDILKMARVPGKNINIFEFLRENLGYKIMISPDGLPANFGMARPYCDIRLQIYDARTLQFIQEIEGNF